MQQSCLYYRPRTSNGVKGWLRKRASTVRCQEVLHFQNRFTRHCQLLSRNENSKAFVRLVSRVHILQDSSIWEMKKYLWYETISVSLWATRDCQDKDVAGEWQWCEAPGSTPAVWLSLLLSLLGVLAASTVSAVHSGISLFKNPWQGR